MSKVRINDLARELEVKSRSILDALTAVGVTEPKTHSSSIEDYEAEKVRGYFSGQRNGSSVATRSRVETPPSLDFSHISKPGDAARLILERKLAAEKARSMPPQRAAAVVVHPPAASTTPAAAAARPVAQTTSAPVAAAPLAP